MTSLFVEVEAAGALRPGEPFVVLEVGSGLGQFAENFLAALDRHCGAAGRQLRARLIYCLSDRNPETVRTATARPELARHLVEGRLLQALFDLRRPGDLRRVDGTELSLTPSVVIANYVCCVSPPAVLRRRGAAFFEQYTSIAVEVADGDTRTGAEIVDGYLGDPVASKLISEMQVESAWREVELAGRFSSGPHVGAVVRAVAGLDPATLLYPQEFIDFLLGISSSLMKPGGLAMVSDYGSSDRHDLQGEHEGRLQLYGNSVSHHVNFSLLDAVASEAGWVTLRSRNPFRSVHSASIRFAATVGNRFRSAFHSAFVRGESGEDLIDFRDVARTFHERKEYRTAARFYRRCLKIDREDPQLLYALGEVCLEGGYLDAAYRTLRRGQRIAPLDYEFDFLLGRTCRGRNRFTEAIQWYEMSLARTEHHVTLANLGELHGFQGNHAKARDCLARAVALVPSYERAVKLLAEIPPEG
ncbi:MAG: tetratricopeptide repeat protein [Myxococcales bacterium]|nr:tetratricopeptide repeat protein [Myxococcales bacterium]